MAVLLVGTVFLALGRTDSVKYDYTEGEYLYQLADMEDVLSIEARFDLELINMSDHLIATFQAKENADMAYLLANGFTLNATNYLFAPPWQSTTDPYLKDQYALTMTHTIEAWTLEQGDAGVTVAIIDSGIDIYHEEFTGRISVLSYNTVTDQTGLAAVIDDRGHGTMVAGIIGAIKDNSEGIAGIAQNVKLLVIKANNPGEGEFQDSSIIEGIYYAVDFGADIINLSLGGSYANPLTKAAIAYALDRGVIVVAASGNDGTDELVYPASFPDVISVSAVSSDRTISDFSNYNREIDIAAPGASIITTALDNGYASVSGTSFAAPQVSGILALLFSYDSNITINELKTKLFATATDVGLVGRDDYYGFGIINSYLLLAKEFVKISFETFAGTNVEAIYVEKNYPFTISETPTLTDHVFIGWYKDALLTDDWVESTDVAAADLTLYAKYTSAFHTVTFVTDGTNAGAITVMHEGTFTLPETYLEGYEFVGWYRDSGYVTPYVTGILTKDLTLYAKFTEIIYHDVFLYVFAEIYDTVSVRDGASISLPGLDITGYDFSGWYLDETYVNQYTTGSITSDLNLYAKLDVIYLDVTLIVEGSNQELSVAYGDIPEFPDVTFETYAFAGWYYDAEYLIPYTNTSVTDNITLYARFVTQAYQVTIVVPYQSTYTVYVLQGDSLNLEDVNKEGYLFSGWYLDSVYLNPYTQGEIISNLTLYAKLDRIWLNVKFYGANGTTVISSQSIEYGHDALAPNAPFKASSTAFEYVFVSWSEDFTHVTGNLHVYPEYDHIFRPASVELLPGIDTIFTGGVWIDGGIRLLDVLLSYTVLESVDETTVGRYVVTYEIKYNQEVEYTLKRIVNVVQAETNVIITLNPGVTTINVGGTYNDAGASTNYGQVVTSGSVDATKAGVYEIVYRVTVDYFDYEKTRYVYVIEETTYVNNVFFVSKREDDYNEI